MQCFHYAAVWLFFYGRIDTCDIFSGGEKNVPYRISCAAIAQLGERQTEDLKVPGSIPGGGKYIFCVTEIPRYV